MSDSASRPAAEATSIGPIPTLPVFFKLNGRRAVLAGGSLPAVWKAELLVSTGAGVSVFDAAPCPDMLELKQRLGELLTLTLRPWQAGDLAGAAVAIGALEGEDAEAFRHAARAAGVPVNIIDIPELCDFQFGTLIARSPLLIAISTDGAAPVFGQALRARIEALLPLGIGDWARAAKLWRAKLPPLAFAARRRFWERFSDLALEGNPRQPTEEDRQSCLNDAILANTSSTGWLDLVGLGPGDADLVTLRAVRALQSADIIVHATETGAAILGLGRREARAIPEASSDASTARLIQQYVSAGRGVVWAAPGDPTVCTRWLDRRIACLVEPRNIIPGVHCPACPNGCGDACPATDRDQ